MLKLNLSRTLIRTARDLLYKYFGQLELLELRFAEIRVNFPWHDAFTNKLTTQTSLAYEKASIIFQIAATHSAHPLLLKMRQAELIILSTTPCPSEDNQLSVLLV